MWGRARSLVGRSVVDKARVGAEVGCNGPIEGAHHHTKHKLNTHTHTHTHTHTQAHTAMPKPSLVW
jgi:hypothetical protein